MLLFRKSYREGRIFFCRCTRTAKCILTFGPKKRIIDGLTGCSAVGSALGSGPRGPGFKSPHSDHNVETKKMSLAKSPIISGFFATQTAIFLCTKTQM